MEHLLREEIENPLTTLLHAGIPLQSHHLDAIVKRAEPQVPHVQGGPAAGTRCVRSRRRIYNTYKYNELYPDIAKLLH